MSKNQIVVAEKDYALFSVRDSNGEFDSEPVLVLKDTSRFWVNLSNVMSDSEFSDYLATRVKLEGLGDDSPCELTVIAWVSPTEYYTINGNTVMFHYSVPSESLDGFLTSCEFGALYREKDTIFVTRDEVDSIDEQLCTVGFPQHDGSRLYFASRTIKDVTRSFPSSSPVMAKAYQVVLNKIKSANTLQSLETPNVMVVSELPEYLKWHENGVYPFEIEKFNTPSDVEVATLREQMKELKENYDFLNENFRTAVSDKLELNTENSRLRSENRLLRNQVEVQEQKIQFMSEFIQSLPNVKLVSVGTEGIEEV